MKFTRGFLIWACWGLSLFCSGTAIFLIGVLAYYRPVNVHLTIFLLTYAYVFMIASVFLSINYKGVN